MYTSFIYLFLIKVSIKDSMKLYKIIYLLNYKLTHRILLILKVGSTCTYFIFIFFKMWDSLVAQEIKNFYIVVCY